MAQKYKFYVPTDPGFAGNRPIASYINPLNDGWGAGMAHDLGGRLVQLTFRPIAPFEQYSSAYYTATNSGTGASIAHGATGLVFTTPSDGTFNLNLQSLPTFTPALGTPACFGMGIEVAVSDIAGVGFSFGFGNAQALPSTTEYTDFLGFRKTVAAATVTGKARGDSGTIATSATLSTLVNAAFVKLSMVCGYDATGNAYGAFTNDDGTTVNQTDFTAAQLAQVTRILTTPPTMYANLAAVGLTSTNPTVTIKNHYAFIDTRTF